MQARSSYVSVEHISTQAQMLVAARMTLSSHSQVDQSSSVALAVVACAPIWVFAPYVTLALAHLHNKFAEQGVPL